MFKDSTPFAKLILTAFVILVSALLFLLLGGLISGIFFEKGFFSGATVLTDESADNVAFLKYFQITASLGMFVVPPFILALMFGNKITGYFGLNKFPRVISLVIVFLVLIFLLPIINFLMEINSHLMFPHFMEGVNQWMKSSEEQAGELTGLFLNTQSFAGLLVNLLMIAIIPAVGEEFLFRGILQPLFGEWTKSRHLGVLFAAALFSAFHLQFFGFLPRFVLGMLFGYLYLWSGTIWLPVIAHFLNNSLSVIAWYAGGDEFGEMLDKPGADMSSVNDVMMLAGSLVLVSVLIFLVFRKEKRIL